MTSVKQEKKETPPIHSSTNNISQTNRHTNTLNDEKTNMNLLPCEHYEYEYKQCNSFRGRLYNYFRNEQPKYECEFYKELFVDCLKYKRDPQNNFESLLKLNKYEKELVEERMKANANNDVWQLRQEPPNDWNAQLPEWCSERIRNSYWYKIKIDEERR
jgi:hypothetical protein